MSYPGRGPGLLYNALSGLRKMPPFLECAKIYPIIYDWLLIHLEEQPLAGCQEYIYSDYLGFW